MSRYRYNVKEFPDEHFKKKLGDYGFARGDLVLYSSGHDETGGIIFRIDEDTSPVKPAVFHRRVKKTRKLWSTEKNDYVPQLVEVDDYGYWDENGRKLLNVAVDGFVRIKPVFDFFATPKGKKPKGKGETLIITYDMLKQLKKVDIVLLGSKYVELGNLLRDVAVKNGMADQPSE